MDQIWLQVTFIIVLVLANGVFAASEIAIVSSRRNRLEQQAEQGSRGARTALELIEEPNRFLATVQVGITLIGIFAGAFGGDRLAGPLAEVIEPLPVVGGATAPLVALFSIVVAITYLSLILGELVPKRLALQHAEPIASSVAPAMRFLSRLAAPVVWFLTISTQAVLRLLGRNNQPEEQVTEEDILSMVRAGMQGGTVEAAEHEFIERVFDFTDVSVRSIMTPRSEMYALSVDTPLHEAVQQVIESSYSRVPVYRTTSDKIEGVLHVKDLLRAAYAENHENAKIEDLMRPPVFVLEHQSLATVLQMFRQTHLHMAFVVDEYGQIVGLVTLEDVLEELTGNIEDEYDELDPMIARRADNSFLVDGLLSYNDAEHELGLPARESIEDELPDFDTIAGLVLALLQHIPATGESITWRDWYFEVVDMDGVRIDKVLIRPRNTADDQAQNEGAMAIGAILPLPEGDASANADHGKE